VWGSNLEVDTKLAIGQLDVFDEGLKRCCRMFIVNGRHSKHRIVGGIIMGLKVSSKA
jgi:hypothetical protein